MQQAKADAKHPLHAFALLAQDPAAAEPARCAELLRPLAEKLGEKLGEQLRAAAQQVELAAHSASTIVDYADPAAPWYQDGFSFGLRPVRVGDVQLAGPPAATTDGQLGRFSQDELLKIAASGYAQSDTAWNVLKLAPGTERDFGSIGNWSRATRSARPRSRSVRAIFGTWSRARVARMPW